MSRACPVCGAWSCRCSDYRLREHLDAHRFTDYGAPVLARWDREAGDRRVEDELRDRTRRREEEAEEERRAERRARERREAQEAEAAAERERVWAEELETRARSELEELFRWAAASGRP